MAVETTGVPVHVYRHIGQNPRTLRILASRTACSVALMATLEPVHEHLELALDGHIGRLILNRPEKLNPLSTGVLLGIESAARLFDSIREVRVVIVEGRGRSFCAGADVSVFMGNPGDETSIRERADAGRRMAEALEAMRAVTVARIQGHCVGGGVVLAAGCDMRVAAGSARFSIPEVALGIPLAWGGIPRLVREVGAPATRDLVMTCRTVEPEEAHDLGLVQRVVPDDELDAAVEDLVTELLDRPTLPMYQTKRAIDAVTSQMVGTDRAFADADALVSAAGDEESREHARSYLERLTVKD